MKKYVPRLVDMVLQHVSYSLARWITSLPVNLLAHCLAGSIAFLLASSLTLLLALYFFDDLPLLRTQKRSKVMIACHFKRN